MPYYSVRITGGSSPETVSNELRDTFRGKDPDFTGHPFFHVKNHSNLADFKSKVGGMTPDGYEADVMKITKLEYDS